MFHKLRRFCVNLGRNRLWEWESIRALYEMGLIEIGSGFKLDPYLLLWTYNNRMLAFLVPKDLAKLLLKKKWKKMPERLFSLPKGGSWGLKPNI